jgi:hypothetical protein
MITFNCGSYECSRSPRSVNNILIFSIDTILLIIIIETFIVNCPIKNVRDAHCLAARFNGNMKTLLHLYPT